MARKLIITVAPTGGFHGKNANPNLPEQPHEIADAVYDAYNAGASIAHIHARDKNGHVTSDVEVFREINTRIRDKCDIILQNSTASSTASGDKVDLGLACLDAGPEMCSLDCGMIVSEWQNEEIIFKWTRNWLKKAVQIMHEKGVKPELEVFNPTHIEDIMDVLVPTGYLKEPLSFNFVMGMNKVSQGAQAYSPESIMYLKSMLPKNALFTVMAIGPNQLPGTVLGMLLGGNIRVGFEDNVYYKKGELAKSNAQLVERAVRFAREFGFEVATPQEARNILGLPQLK